MRQVLTASLSGQVQREGFSSSCRRGGQYVDTLHDGSTRHLAHPLQTARFSGSSRKPALSGGGGGGGAFQTHKPTGHLKKTSRTSSSVSTDVALPGGQSVVRSGGLVYYGHTALRQGAW